MNDMGQDGARLYGAARAIGSATESLVRWVDRIAARRHVGWMIGGGYTLLLLTLGLLLHTSGDGASESDFFGSYVSQARHFLEGSIVIDPFRGPAYPIILGLVALVLAPFGAALFETGIILSVLSAGIVLVLMYGLIRDVYSPRHALVSVVLVIANPVFVRYSYTTGNDMFFVAFAFAAMYAFMRPHRLRWGVLVVAGVLTALAYLVRYTGVATLVAAVFVILVLNVWRRSWKDRIVAVLAFVGVFLVVMTPWSLYCKHKTGMLVYNRNYVNVALGVYLVEGDVDRFLAENSFESIWDVITYDPVRLLLAIPEHAIRHAHTVVVRVIPFPVSALAFLACVFMLVRPPTRREAAFLAFGLIYFGVILMVFFSDRFVLFLIPFVATLAASGIFQLGGAIHTLPRARPAVAAVLLLVTLGSAGYAVLYNTALIRGQTQDLKALGKQFMEKVPPERRGKIVMARMPHFAYYAGLDFVRLPLVSSYEELLEQLRLTDADYLFYGLTAQRTRGELGSLMDPYGKHPGLRLLADSSIGVLYQVERDVPGGEEDDSSREK